MHYLCGDIQKNHSKLNQYEEVSITLRSGHFYGQL